MVNGDGIDGVGDGDDGGGGVRDGEGRRRAGGTIRLHDKLI